MATAYGGPYWPGLARAGPAGKRMAAAAATGLSAGAMRAAERGWAASPPPRSRAYAAAWSGPPSSGAVLGLSAGGQAPAECSLSPAPSCSGSTLSLLSPLGRPGFPFDGEDGEDGEAEGHGREAEAEAGGALEAPVAGSLTPWELWFVGKEKEERERLQQRALEELRQQVEKRKQMEEQEKRKVISEEKHRAWVQRKKEQKRKEREEKINKEMEEKAAKELEKEHLQEKAKEKYQEWLKKKNAEDCEKKKKAKETEKQRQAELLEKKEIAERKFKEWLENAKNKPRPAAKSYGFANGRLTGFYSGNSYPEPAFYNPIPWKPIHAPPPHAARGLSRKKSRQLAGPRLLAAVSSSSLAARGARTGLGLGTVCGARR